MRAELRVALRVIGALLLATLAIRFIITQWAGISASLRALQPSWGGLLLASAAVVVGYAVLIASWRALLATWDSPLPLPAAARIWFVSSLGKYVPGKIWAIGAMAVLARDAGASPAAATGSAIIMQVINLAAGFVVVLVAGAGQLWAVSPQLRVAAVAAIAATAVGLAAGPQLLAWSTRLLGRVTRRDGIAPQMPVLTHALLLRVFVANVVAWIAYGVGFGLFWHALLGRGGGVSSAALAVYTASYLLGFLALIAPGGLGVREAVLTGLLISLRLASPPDAAVLAAASRLWLTVLEVVPGLVFLPGLAVRNRSSPSTSDGPLG